jgi:flagellar biosynthetic protein FlhB
MADSEQEQNRSEQATPFKLKEAQERGMVAKSTEFNGAVATLAFIGLLYVAGQSMFERLARLDAALLSRAHRFDFSEAAALAWLSSVLVETLSQLAPVFALLVLAGVLASLVQTGLVFSFEPLKPDFDRVNPVAGLKRLFTLKLVFEAVKSLVKLALLGYALYALLQDLTPLALGLAQTDPHAYARIGLDTVAGLMFKLGLVMLLIALLDLGYVRWDFAKKMMMSRREMKDEHKRREGDPKIRQRMKELHREMRKRAGALSKVPEADVLVTNPQHIAVALLYRKDEMRAPQVIAKGAGDLAAKMRELARRHRVPIVENRRLARALFVKCRLDAAVPDSAFAETARILAWVYALRELQGSRGRRMPA